MREAGGDALLQSSDESAQEKEHDRADGGYTYGAEIEMTGGHRSPAKESRA